MSALTRRQSLALGAALAALPGLSHANGVGEPGLTLGPAAPFYPGMVVDTARRLATETYQPVAEVPRAWRDLQYDDYRHMWFDSRNALWQGSDRPARVEFFAPGLYFPRPVRIHSVDTKAGTAEAIKFDFAVFDKTDKLPDLPIDDTLGYSGFRLRGPIRDPGIHQEYAVFQGASYFRAVGRDHVYGISGRGIAVGTASPEGEEFPDFTDFWIEAPEPGNRDIVVHALLDGPSVTGAYRFVIRHGETTSMDVSATIFARRPLDNIGLGVGTSMFLFDETNHFRFEDFRPAVHDSDGLLVWNGAGERLWRPLANPVDLQVSSFVDEGPRGFGLMQRARRLGDFADLEAHYHDRPGMWITPGENWGPGAVTLVEIPADREIFDNIVCYWRPRATIPAGASYDFTYRIDWCTEAPVTGDRAHVLNTHMGRSFSGRRIAAIDFAPHHMIPEDLAEVTIHTSANRGKVSDGILQRNPETGGVRLDFGFDPVEGRSQELRAQLMHSGRAISEVWMYRWTG